MKKNLFLVAGYDKDGIIDDALSHYVKQLSKNGDVILCMDSTCKKSETNKLKPYVIHVIATRHGEYDFGSYKRFFQYACEKDILQNYDCLYLVNDSVFGPVYDISKLLNRIESLKTDAVGAVVSKHRTHVFMESWFVRLDKKIFASKWFYDFMNSVQKERGKADVTIKYEHGLTNLIRNNNCSWTGVRCIRGRFTYNHPKKLFKSDIPFIKKMSFTRHNGALGGQIKFVLNHSDKNAKNVIIKSANRLYGKRYIDWFLTYNPFKILYRNFTYVIQKLKHGGI